jgi:hypothetical protein
LYAEQGNLDAAKATLEKGIQTSSVYGTIYKNLGMIYAQIARNSYGKALQLGTRPTIPHLALLDPMTPAPVSPAPAPAKPTSTPAAGQKPASAVKTAATQPKPAAAPAPAAAAETAKVPVKTEATKATPAKSSAPAAVKPVVTAAPAAVAPPQLRTLVISKDQAIQDTVLAWAQAWSDKDYAAYSSFYAESYQPRAGRSRVQWEALRRRRLERPQWIKVALSDIRIKPIGTNKAQVTFTQSYASNFFHDVSRKALDVVEINGRWRIAAEHSLGAGK